MLRHQTSKLKPLNVGKIDQKSNNLDKPSRLWRAWLNMTSPADRLPVCYWHELLDLVFFYKAKHNLVHLSPSVVPIVRESARTTRTSATRFPISVPKRCRTTTYQKSFLIRTTRIWSLLTGRVDLANSSLTSFKSLLYDYYSRAVRMN